MCLTIGCSDDSTEPNNNNPAPALSHVWSSRFGDAGSQFVRSVAVDTSGNVIITGYFNGGADFGGGTLTSAGDYDIFLAKFGSNGAYVWSKRFGDASQQTVQGVAVDAFGNVFIAGYFEGTVDFGGGPLTSAGLRDIFVAKFASDGSHLWSNRFGDSNYQAANALAVDGAGNVIIAGVFMGSADFGGGALTSAGGWDVFMAKFDGSGAYGWSKRFGDGNNQFAPALAVDGSNNVIVGGYFAGSVDFGGGALTSAGGEDMFVAKLGSDGGHLWSNRFGDASTEQQVWSVAVDGSDNVVLTGYFTGSVDFGGGTLPYGGGADIFVAELASGGAHLWSKSFGGGANQYGWGVAVDASDNVILTGAMNGTVDFGGGALTSAGANDVFIAKLDPGGGHLASNRFGDANYQTAQAIAVDKWGRIVIAGYFEGTVNFGGGVLTSAGGEDAFVAKFNR